MASVRINVDFLQRQAQANAEALNRSFLGLNTSLTGLYSAVQLASTAIAGISSAFAGTIGSAVKLQSSIGEIETLLDDTAGAQEQFTAQILELQRNFGTDQTDAAQAFYNALSSGAVDATDANELLNVAQKLAIGGIVDLSTATDGLTTVINAYGLNASDATSVSDALFTAMRAGRMFCPVAA